MNLITVVSLGNSLDSLTLGSLEAMRSARRLILRTEQTPSADYRREKGIAYETLDALYEDAEDFDALNAALTKAVLEAAEATPVVYAVLDAQWDESVHNLMENHAEQLVREHPEVGALVFECTNMPPFAAAVQKKTGLPVFDYTTLADYVYSALIRRPFEGFM